MAGFKRTQKRAAAADSDSEKPQKKKKKESSKPVLKTATVGGQKSAKKQLSSGADNDGNPFWEMSATRRVTISQFKGTTMVNLREYYDDKGELKPGKKGISLSLQQYQVLLDSIPAINAQLRERGDEVKDPAFNPSTGVAKGADEEAGGRDEDEDEKEKEVADEEEEEDASE